MVWPLVGIDGLSFEVALADQPLLLKLPRIPALGRSRSRLYHPSTGLLARLDPGLLDHLGPLRDLALDGGRELRGRAADHVQAEVVELLAHVGHRQNSRRIAM